MTEKDEYSPTVKHQAYEKILNDLYQLDTNHSQYTPNNLAEEICSKIINWSGDICVLYCVSLLRSVFKRVVKQYGMQHALKHITFIASDMRKIEFCQEGINKNIKYKYVKWENLGKWLKEKHNMKFDIVVGNPPYSIAQNRAKNNSPIYHLFFNKIVTILNDNGFIAWVQPDTWRKAYRSSPEFIKFRKTVNRHLTYLARGLSPFKDAAVIVDWFIYSQNQVSSTIFINADKISISESEIDFMLPEFPFVTKMLCSDRNKFYVSSNTTYPPTSKGCGSKLLTSEFCYPVFCAGKISQYANIKMPYHDDNKVMVSLLRSLRPTIDNGSVGLGSDAGAFLTTPESIEFFTELLQSDEIKALQAAYGEGRWNGKDAGKRNRASEFLGYLKLPAILPSRFDGKSLFNLDESDYEDIKSLIG